MAGAWRNRIAFYDEEIDIGIEKNASRVGETRIRFFDFASRRGENHFLLNKSAFQRGKTSIEKNEFASRRGEKRVASVKC